MSKQSTIAPNKGARKARKRICRGNSGSGGTYGGRWFNGQNSRSGGGVHVLFEWGQSPLHLRLPKMRWFKRTIKIPFVVINLDDLETIGSDVELTREVLLSKRILAKSDEKLKILARGKIKSAITIHADAASSSAIKAIEKAGGKVVLPESPAPKEWKRAARKIERKEKTAAIGSSAKKETKKAAKAPAKKTTAKAEKSETKKKSSSPKKEK